MTSGKEGPRFLDPNLRSISIDEQKCRTLLQRFLREHGRKETYPIGNFMEVKAGNSQGMNTGLYSVTNFTPEELSQGELLAVSHFTVLTSKLLTSERLKNGQNISITPSGEFATSEGYAILEIKIGNLP